MVVRRLGIKSDPHHERYRAGESVEDKLPPNRVAIARPLWKGR